MKIALNGAGGFLGRELIDYYAQTKPNVILQALYSHSAAAPQASPGLIPFQGALQDSSLLGNWLEGCAAVFHLAERGFPSQESEHPEFQITTNVTNAARLVCAMREKGIKKLIYASSGGALYDGLTASANALVESSPVHLRTPYSVSKFLVERLFIQLIENEGWDIKILRISNPYGIHQVGSSQQGIIGMMVEKAHQDEEFPLWVPLTTSKDFISATDLAGAFDLFYQGGEAGVYNIGSGLSCSLGQLFETLEKVTQRKVKFRVSRRDLQEPLKVALDCSKAKGSVGWEPSLSLEKGLTQLWEWRVKQKKVKLAA